MPSRAHAAARIASGPSWGTLLRAVPYSQQEAIPTAPKALLFVSALLLASPAAGLAAEETKAEARPFAPGGTLEVHLRAGDVRLFKGSDAGVIVLRYTMKAKQRNNLDRVSLRFDTSGSLARIEFEAPPGVDIETRIAVPTPTNLRVRIRAGDIQVGQLEGDQDLLTYVGDIEVEVGPKPGAIYREIEASTHIGDISSTSLGKPQGWLGKSLRYHGDGAHRLDARTGVGDIRLYSTPFPTED